MKEFIDNLRNSGLFQNKRNLIILVILLVALPVGIFLITKQQIFKSRASGELISLTGANVTRRADGSYVMVDASHPTITLQLTSTLDKEVPPPASPAPPTPSASSNPPASPAPEPGRASATITANPTTSTAGHAVTVSWSSTNAAKCYLDYPGVTGEVSTSGSDVYHPEETTTYGIRCEAPGVISSSRQTVTITVNPPLPCTDKDGSSCTFDTQTAYVRAGTSLRRETVTAYGRYWNWDETAPGQWQALDKNGSTLASYPRYANGPCAGKTGTACVFDTHTVYVQSDGTRRESVTADGKYWNWANAAGSGDWNAVGTMGGELRLVERYNTSGDTFSHPGPCYGRSVCKFDTQTVYVRSNGLRRETVTAYGKYWNWDEIAVADRSNPDIAPKLLDGAWMPLDSNNNDLTSYPRYANGPCAGQSTCTFDTHVVYIRANSSLRRETITAYGKYWNWDEDPSATGGWSALGSNGNNLTKESRYQ